MTHDIVTKAAVTSRGTELIRRINEVLRRLSALERPFVEPCLDVSATVMRMPEADVLVAVGVNLEQTTDALVHGALGNVHDFVNAVRASFAHGRGVALKDQIRKVVRCETVFEEECITRGLTTRPDIASFEGLGKIMTARNKAAIFEILQQYGVEKVGERVTFDPVKLPVSAQRRLLDIIEKSLPKPKRVQEKLPQALARPVVSGDFDSEADFFHDVMGAADSGDRPALQQNNHNLGNFISDLSPIQSNHSGSD